MKRFIFAVLVITAFFYSCKKEQVKDGTVKEVDSQVKSEHWANFDDYLDVKSVATVDTVKLRKELNKIMTPEKIIYNFGSGYHNFYLALYSSPREEATYQLNNFMWWVDSESYLYSSYLYEKTNKDFSVKPTIKIKNTDLSAVIKKKDHTTVGPIFNLQYDNTEKIFNVKPGKLNGKEVRSVKFYEINIIVDENKKIIKPWAIHEIDCSNFRPQLKSNFTKWDFEMSVPTILFEDIISLKKKIALPAKAAQYCVTGRLLIKIFVDEKGNYAGHQLIKGLGYGCDEAVIEAVKNIKLAPSSNQGKGYLIVPFDFGAPKGTPVDLAVKIFEYNSDPKVYNKLKLSIENKNKLKEKINIRYNVSAYVDGELKISNYCSEISAFQQQNTFFFGGDKLTPGKHQYAVYIDPEGVLNDINRDNNIFKGSFEVK